MKAEYANDWPDISHEFTEATLAEPGNKWFEWSRSIKDSTQYVLIEAFEDDAAGAHVGSDHFQEMQREFPQYLAATPKIFSHQIDADDWDEMGELQIDRV